MNLLTICFFIFNIFLNFFLYIFSLHLKIFSSPAVICSFLQINAYFWGSHLIYFSFMMMWKWYRFNKILISNFEFWSFPGHDMQSMRLGRDSEPPRRVSKASSQGQTADTSPIYIHTAIPLFTFSTVFNKSHEIFNSLS